LPRGAAQIGIVTCKNGIKSLAVGACCCYLYQYIFSAFASASASASVSASASSSASASVSFAFSSKAEITSGFFAFLWFSWLRGGRMQKRSPKR
jgi:hypothetical protein